MKAKIFDLYLPILIGLGGRGSLGRLEMVACAEDNCYSEAGEKVGRVATEGEAGEEREPEEVCGRAGTGC